MAEEQNEIGIATGLAWTEVGGEILVTEATLMPGKGNLTMTGKLGDVMQESAQAALSTSGSEGQGIGIPKDFHQKIDIHVHVPEGAFRRTARRRASRSPRPSFSPHSEPARRDVAMTGEITLRGMVLPIGGVKEKVLAAHRAGIKNIVLPWDNEKDLADIPKNVLDELDVPPGVDHGRGAEDRAGRNRWRDAWPKRRPNPWQRRSRMTPSPTA